MIITHIDSTGCDYDADFFPPECIDECSACGDVEEAVIYWVKRLDFQAPVEGLKSYLRTFGAWSDDELNDHEQNLKRLFWSIACDIAEKEARHED